MPYNGETPTVDGDYTVVRFLETGEFITPSGVTEGEALVVAGGGGGSGGGGGAGGYLTGTQTLSGTMTVTVGAGGTAGQNGGYLIHGGQGGGSSFGTRTAAGGGGGGEAYIPGSDGGSGGGGGYGLTDFYEEVPLGGTATPSGQGNDGGNNANYGGDPWPTGGGGGAGADGGDATSATAAGNGGAGLNNDIVETGVNVGYAGGGGGCVTSNSGTGYVTTASHGGGRGTRASLDGEAGTASTGGGGGGCGSGSADYYGGAGGSGIVVVRYLTPIQYTGTGTSTLAPVKAEGVGDAFLAATGKSTIAKVKAVGVGTVSAFHGPYSGTGKLTVAGPKVFGGYGLMPPVPPTPSAALTSTAHSLIGHISVTIGGVDYTPWAENLQFDSNVSGGYGACSMNLRPPTLVPAYDAAVSITGPGGLLWSGTVVNTPDITYTGENVRYEVVAEGPYRAYGRAEDFAWTSSDSDLGAWEQIDCQNWDAAAAGFEISTSVAAGLGFLSSDLDDIAEDGTPIAAAKAFEGKDDAYYTNMPPDSAPADFIDPKVLWSAHYYWIGRGLTEQRITGLKANAMYDLETPLSDALTVPDYDNGTPNDEGTWEWLDPEWVEDPPGTWTATVIPWDASYPDMDMWAELYGIDPPGSMWAGIYAIDNPRDLPVRDPIAMLTHDSLIHKFEPHTKTVQAVYARDENGHYIYDEFGNLTFDVEAEAAALDLNCDCKMLVFYATYVVTQVPMWTGMDFDPMHVRYNASHEGDTVLHAAICDEPLQRFGWYASNRMFTEGKQYVTLANAKVLANSASGSSSADLMQALNAASGGGDIQAFSLPEGVSINNPPYATRLSAIQQLVGMVAEPVYWGWDPGFFCVSSRGSKSFDATYPGVTVAASIKNDGTITSATVIYSGADEEAGAPEDRRVLAAWVPNSLSFDVNGDGRVGDDENAGLIDGSYVLHSAAAAAAVAQSYIEERGVTGAGTGNPSLPQWEGTITLRGISGAAATKVATKVTAGDVTDAVVTAVSVDVDSDTVTLSLGGTGYAGRFPISPGSPNSAVPSNAAAMRHILPYQTRRR